MIPGVMGDLPLAYPGSKELRKVNHVTPDESPADRAIQELGPGKILLVQGIEVEFYSIGQLAEALNRQPVTIRAWEKDGTLPSSGWTKPGQHHDPRGKRRLWTKKQVTGIVRIAMEENVWQPGPRVSIGKTEFTKKVTELFTQLRKEGIR